MTVYAATPLAVTARFAGAPDSQPVDGVVTAPRFQFTYRPFYGDYLSGDDIASVTWTPPSMEVRPGLPNVELIHLILTSPEEAQLVTVARPPLVVGLVADDDTDYDTYTIEVRYSSNGTFPANQTTTVTATTTLADGGEVLYPTTDLIYYQYWQARLLNTAGDVIVDWRPRQSFFVASAPEDTDLPVTWTVDANTAAPAHLWHFDPPGVQAGEDFTIYGQGFTTASTVRYGPDTLTVKSRTLVPAQPDNTSDAQRLIDGPTVTCEHWQIVAVAPDTDDVGDVVTVEN